MSDEPSNFALQISERLVSGESTLLTAEELAGLSEYERTVLQKTAVRLDYKAFYDLVSGEVTLRKVFE